MTFKHRLTWGSANDFLQVVPHLATFSVFDGAACASGSVQVAPGELIDTVDAELSRPGTENFTLQFDELLQDELVADPPKLA